MKIKPTPTPTPAPKSKAKPDRVARIVSDSRINVTVNADSTARILSMGKCAIGPNVTIIANRGSTIMLENCDITNALIIACEYSTIFMRNVKTNNPDCARSTHSAHIQTTTPKLVMPLENLVLTEDIHISDVTKIKGLRAGGFMQLELENCTFTGPLSLTGNTKIKGVKLEIENSSKLVMRHGQAYKYEESKSMEIPEAFGIDLGALLSAGDVTLEPPAS